MAETLEQRLREFGRAATCIDATDCVGSPEWVLDEIANMVRHMTEAADALAAMSCPEGWKMVPVGSHHAMDEAAQRFCRREYGEHHSIRYFNEIYRAMLSAAPSPPTRVLMPELRALTHPVMRDEDNGEALSGNPAPQENSGAEGSVLEKAQIAPTSAVVSETGSENEKRTAPEHYNRGQVADWNSGYRAGLQDKGPDGPCSDEWSRGCRAGRIDGGHLKNHPTFGKF